MNGHNNHCVSVLKPYLFANKTSLELQSLLSLLFFQNLRFQIEGVAYVWRSLYNFKWTFRVIYQP